MLSKKTVLSEAPMGIHSFLFCCTFPKGKCKEKDVDYLLESVGHTQQTAKQAVTNARAAWREGPLSVWS